MYNLTQDWNVSSETWVICELYDYYMSLNDFKPTEISIYPNPTSRQFTIQSNSTEIQQIEIFSLQGRSVFNANYISHKPIDISELPEGMYLVKIQTESGSLNKKLVKK